MRQMHPLQHVVKQMVEERQREAAQDAIWRRHSRTGLLRRFLENIAGRVNTAGNAAKESRP